MNRLFAANFARLWKNKSFWFMEAAIFAWASFAYVMYSINVDNLGLEWVVSRSNSYFFNSVIYIGMAIAIFVGFFVGTEYADGTMRNKICVGHTRSAIYMANLIVCVVAGLLFIITHKLAAVVIGLPLVGPEVLTGLNHPMWGMCYEIFIVVVYTAIFTLVAMLNSNKARAITVGLLLSLFLIFGGIATYSGLEEPEYVSRVVMSEEGKLELQENVVNSRYLSGVERSIYECIDTICPSSQGMRLADSDGEFSVKHPLGAAGVSLVISALGIALFQKKDIK